MTSTDREPDLPPRVYWTVAVVAVGTMVLLYWFTATWNLPLPAAEAGK